MSRLGKSHKPSKEKAKPKIEPAYAENPSGNIYVVYARYNKAGVSGMTEPRCIVHTFAALYAAKHFVDLLCKGADVTWAVGPSKFDKLFSTFVGVKVESEHLREIYEYEPTELEAGWRDERLNHSIASLVHAPVHENMKLEGEDETSDEPRAITKREKSNRTRQADPNKKPRADTTGMVSANKIADELGVHGREVRAVLRAMKEKKPDHGWAWTVDEANKMRDKIKAALDKKKAK